MHVANTEYVSIIVPVYEAGDYLAQCLDSLVGQTYSNVEILVIYKKSSDNTETLLNEYKGRVTIIEQTGKSPANARNLGIARCKGDYVAFCDADDLFDYEKTEKQVAFVKEHDVDLVYSDFYVINSRGHVIDKIKTRDWDFKRWLRSGYIAFSTVLIRKELLIKANCFDEKWSSNEDLDLLIRLSRRAEFKRIPEYLACRRLHSGGLSRSVRKTLLSRSQVYSSHGYVALAVVSYLVGMVYSSLFYFLVDHPFLYHRVKKLRRG